MRIRLARSVALLPGVVLCLACFTNRAYAQVRPPEELVPAAGDWISIPYAEKVMATRSPVAAAEASPPLAFTVTRTPQQTLVAATSFHETRRMRVVRTLPGSPRRLVMTQAETAPRADDETFTVPVSLVTDHDVTELKTTLGLEMGEAQRYRHLPRTVDAWAAEVLLAGSYIDAKGRAWVFGSDLQATTPEGEYPYRIALDPSEAGCDYFETPDEKAVGGERRTGFKWDGRSLQLYRIVYDTDGPPISCEKAPFAVLTRSMPAATRTGLAGTCLLDPLAIEPKAKGDVEHFVSRGGSFTLEHVNAGRQPNPSIFTDAPIAVVHADGSRCEFDPTNYGRELWASHDRRSLAVVSYSGSSADMLFVDVATCKERARLNVYGPRVKVDGDLVLHAGDCEMASDVRGFCVPASAWRLDSSCRPVRLDEPSIAWTRERFGVGFSTWSIVDRPFTPGASWMGAAQPVAQPGLR